MAQRGLPGMNSVEFGMDMVDGFHAGNRKDKTGYALRLTAQTYAKHGNKWTYGVEMLKRYYPYRDSQIPLWQYTAEAGYAYNFYSSPEKLVFLNIGVSGMLGYEAVNRGERGPAGPCPPPPGAHPLGRCRLPLPHRFRRGHTIHPLTQKLNGHENENDDPDDGRLSFDGGKFRPCFLRRHAGGAATIPFYGGSHAGGR